MFIFNSHIWGNDIPQERVRLLFSYRLNGWATGIHAIYLIEVARKEAIEPAISTRNVEQIPREKVP